jgi:RHS repeat-associated protein
LEIAINNGSGRYTRAFSDLVVYSRTAPLYLGRTHASERQGNPDHFGWSWSFDEKLILLQNLAIYTLPDGGAVTYIDDGDGYKPAMGHITTKLTREDERTFRFDYKGGGSSTFKIPDGLTPDPEHADTAVLRKTTDTNGFSNTFVWDRTGERLLKMQGPDPSQYIKLQWADDCQPPRLESARDSHGRTVCYDYKAFTSPRGDRDYLLSEVTLTGDRSISFRYHQVLGQRRYELMDVSHNGVLQQKVVANALSQGQILEVTHRPDKTLSFKRDVDPDTGVATSTLTRSSASGDTPLGQSQRVRYQVDFKDRVVQAEDNLGQLAHYEWDDATYNLVRAFDDQGHEARYSYDDRRNLISVQDQLGRTQETEWDSQDNPIASVDTLGRRSTATFDAQRRPLTVTDPLNHTTTMTWSADGLLTAVTNNLGNSVRMEHDSKGFLKAIILPATATNGSARLSVKRNSNDEVISSTDALGRVYECKRDELGRAVKASSPAVSARYRQECLPQAETHAKFNRNELLESLKAADGRVTSYRYDLAERLVEVQETGYPAPTRIAYDSFDNVKSVTRPNGATTVYSYDQLNRPVLVQYPGGDRESMVYDARGRVSEWHRGSQVIFYEYDSVDRVTRMHCPATGDDYHYTFDNADRLLTLEDQTGTTNYEYTDNDLLHRITHPGNKSLTYGYDQGDRLISILDPESVLTEYSFNERNQLVQARHDNQTVSYSYDILGRATSIQLPNGVRGQQVFDERDRLLYRNYRRGNSPLVTLKYAYNQLGQRVLDDRTMPNGNQLARFTYNQRLELVKSKRERGGCAPPEVHTYAYDLNHNRIEADGVNYSNNLADQLLSVGAGGSLTYNDAGQAQNVQGWDVTYNCADQITGIQMPGKSIAYRYDGAGQRVQKTVNGVTQKFLWNGGDIAKEYNADDSVKADYFLGAGREGIKTNGQWHYYLSDIQGSTLMLTDSSGNSAATYDYSDYGETTQTSGSASVYNPFLYTGQELDKETGFYHLRARHYAPSLGKFLSRDPIGYAGGSNLYSYCGGDPINYVDPSGLDANLSIVVVEGGTYNALGHSWLEVAPIAGTSSNWSQKTSYGSYPEGVKVNADLTSGYGPGTQRVRVTIRLNAQQEKAFLKWEKEAKNKKWTPENNCAPFSISGWNVVAPEANDINSADAQERVSPDMVSDPRAKQALRIHKRVTGRYPLEVTPRQLGTHLSTIPGHINQ